MGKEQCLFLGVLKKILGRRSEENFRQLHLWLSNAWYSTEGTIWTAGKSLAFWWFTSCSLHSGIIRDTSLAIRTAQAFLGTHRNQTRTLGVFCSPSLLSHHLGMAVARLPPGAPQVLLAWCVVDWSWSPRHSLGLYCWSERLGLSSPSSLFHKTLTYFLETIKCLWAKEGGDPREGETELH